MNDIQAPDAAAWCPSLPPCQFIEPWSDDAGDVDDAAVS